jgi:hypothetical protein
MAREDGRYGTARGVCRIGGIGGSHAAQDTATERVETQSSIARIALDTRRESVQNLARPCCRAAGSGARRLAAAASTPLRERRSVSDRRRRDSMGGDASAQRRRSLTIALATAVAASAASAQDAPPVEPQQPAPPESKPEQASSLPSELQPPPPVATGDFFGVPVHGTLSLGYLLRTSSQDSDQDVYGLLGVDIGDPERQRVTAHFLAKSAWDLDGTSSGSTFSSLEDTYGHSLTAQLYEAYADYHADAGVDFVRLGRQILEETPVQTYFDGLRVDSKPIGTLSGKFGAYGGVPSHLYESSPEGDVIVGAFGELRPFTATRARLDFMQVKDEYLALNRNNAMARLAVWQQLGDSLSVYGDYTLLDWQSRDFQVRGTWTPPDHDLQVEVSYFELLKTQRAQAIEFDPYFESAGEYDPYRELRASASKGIGKHFSVAGGADVRRLVHDADEGDFNHDFERWYLSPTLIDFPIQGMTITLTGDLWNARDEVTSTGELDVTQAFTKETKAHAGTSYSLYKYDILTMSERDHLRTYYVGIETRATKTLRLRLDYAYEVDPFDHYNTLRAAATWTF